MDLLKRGALLLGAGALAACSDATSPTAEVPDARPAASVQPAENRTIPDQYIVMFGGAVADAPGLARSLVAAHGGELQFTYQHAIKGFSARLSAAAADAIARNPNVVLVEADQVVTLSGTQTNATWGLDRIDQRLRPLDGSYTWGPSGSGVNAYIIDTGILLSHTDFGGRAVDGFDAVDGPPAADCHGHGTHVAGTVGGDTYGVAKGVKLYAVRVLNCQGSGTNSGVIAGIDWVTGNHEKPAVANMSLGGGASSTLDAAVQNSIAAGITYAIAAGNGNIVGIEQDACKYSPARVPEAITVGATTQTDAKASWSNFGSCVDFFAPGVGITSAWASSNTATNTISGTSMATPHVAGAAALYLELNAGATPQQVRDALYDMTTKGIVTSSRTANNHLLYTGEITSGGGSTPNSPPTANFTYSCTDLACTFTDASTDPDGNGTILSRSWTFGDQAGGTSTATNPSYTYASGGTYTVELTVTDDHGVTDVATQQVTVSAPDDPPPPSGITLSVNGYKVRGVQAADLTWGGANGTSVDVYRDGAVILTTANDGFETDNIGVRGGGSYTYRVCEAGTTTCSSEVTITF